ncbi:MAG: acyl-CoA dehydrogenase family protein [Deltaproteobacteria bacterium]|nr:acyl-CoA dehydrogenase family protein [Deltaproteobacteria bacterium]
MNPKDGQAFQVLDTLPEPHPDWYASDPAFQAVVRRLLTPGARDWIAPQLSKMGAAASLRVDPLSRIADRHSPTHRPYDAYGRRVDEIVHHPAYREMEAIAYGSGMVGLKYDPEVRHRFPASGHVLGFSLGYLFAQAESGLYCPVCMTDGAARVVERYGTPEQRARVIPRLAAHEPDHLWRGAMFLTEKQGGSDVGAAATRAERAEGEGWRLWGEKWFCSNVDAEAILTLARPDGAPAGTKGLALFLVERPHGAPPPPGMRIERIKDKLGVRSMATGEVAFEGVAAQLMGPADRGFKAMTVMINLSRLYNAVDSVAVARRAALEATRYLRRRRSFGKRAAEHPLVREALADLHAEQIAATHCVFQTAEHLDRADAGSQLDERRVRLLTPMVKASTARLAVTASSEAIELLGGNGFIEDFVTPRLLRDAQVLPVWEGTTNILLLDMLRACEKERAHTLVLEDVRARCAPGAPGLEREAELVSGLAGALSDELESFFKAPTRPAAHLRRWADRLMLACSVATLVEGARSGGAAAELLAASARRLVRRHLEPHRDPLEADTAVLVDAAVLEG